MDKNHDIERGVRKAQLLASYQVAVHARDLFPYFNNFFDDMADELLREARATVEVDYSFEKMQLVSTDNVKLLLPNASETKQRLGQQLQEITLAELATRFEGIHAQAFAKFHELFVSGWATDAGTFDWFHTFSVIFAKERKDNGVLRAAFDGHILTEVAQRLELTHAQVEESLEAWTLDALQELKSIKGDTAKILEIFEEWQNEQKRTRSSLIPEKALRPDPSYLPKPTAGFYYSLSLGKLVVEKSDQSYDAQSHNVQSDKEQFRVAYEAMHYSEDDSAYRSRRWEPEKAEDVLERWLRQGSIHVVTGEPGSGKTTLLGHWARTLHQRYLEDRQNQPFALYVPLRELRDLSSESLRKEGLQSYFDSVGLWGYAIDIDPFSNGEKRAVWLLDGWDELEMHTLPQWQTLIQNLSGTVIVSCRVAQYNHEFGQDHLIMGLDKAQQNIYLELLTPELQRENPDAYTHAAESWRRRLVQELSNHPHLRQLATNPMLLKLIAETNSPGQITLPKTRADFYQDAQDEMLERRLSKLSARQRRNVQRILVEIARYAGRTLTISEDTYLDALEAFNAPEEAEEYIQASGLLNRKGSHYEFLHATFQEYNLAKALAESSTLRTEVEAYWRQLAYEEVLALLWSMATRDDRQKATEFLISAGCQPQLKQQGEEKRDRKQSGLRTALHLWHKSGVPLDEETLNKLWIVLKQGREGGRLRIIAVAADAVTPAQLLELLSGDEYRGVHRRFAEHPNTPEAVLLKLAKNLDGGVRWSVASNSNTPEAVLLELTEDLVDGVRWSVASNPNICLEHL